MIFQKIFKLSSITPRLKLFLIRIYLKSSETIFQPTLGRFENYRSKIVRAL